MRETAPTTFQKFALPAVLAAAVIFLYFTVLTKLVQDWWTDENYSHGILVPFVIAFIIWNERERILESSIGPSVWVGSMAVAAALAVLAAGTLGAELFVQRISLVLMLAGIAIYIYGARSLSLLAVPIALLVLAIPIPQILFNRIAIPLQLWASQTAVWGIRLFEVPVVRKGNVIDILPLGATQTFSLEVVEACSGIRSLMTLVTLALVLAYITRVREGKGIGGFTTPDLWRAIILTAAAVPIAVLTNAARVTSTGILTFYYGKKATEPAWHDASGWLVYVVALVLLITVNLGLKKLFRDKAGSEIGNGHSPGLRSTVSVLPLIIAIFAGGLAVNWFVNRGEVVMPRTQLTALPELLGEWLKRGEDIKFGADVESVLRTTDYTMREYTDPDGRIANIYVGYYETQRTGATYHSPQNCLPGAGWVMSDAQTVEIKMSNGRTFRANRYFVKNGIYNEVMIYWYQGRGRTEASEYYDKINTVLDSVTRRRTDGAIVRVMTSVGNDEAAAVAAASDLAAKLAEELPPFIPE